VKIRVRDHARVEAERMAKIALAATDRVLLDLYCLAPGQSQRPHAHEGQDKIYYVVEGTGRVTVGGVEEPLAPGEATLAPAGAEHGLVNDGAVPLLVLVVVAPPPPHAGPGGSPR
jgi:mannose-6-phosphate isomerase-like protein (cupin superfamily)